MRAFERGLRELGYAPGDDVLIDERYASGEFDKLSAHAAELVGLGAGVLFVAGAPAALAAKKAATALPIIFTAVADPVGLGLVASLARPGGNVTGLADLNTDIIAKRLEILREVAPAAPRIGVILNPTNPTNPPQLRLTEASAATLGVALVPFAITTQHDIDAAFAAIQRERCGALLAIGDPFLRSQMRRIIDLTLKLRLPAMYSERQYPEAGGLMSYGANRDDLYRRAAVFFDKISKGAKPGELPVEQPNKFELAVNLKTAKALEISIPSSVILRADEVIE